MKRLIIGFFILILLLVGGFAAAIMTLNSIDWSEYEEPIAQAVKDATGRELRFSGELSVNISLSPGISADDVTLQNAAWASRDEMMKLEHVEVQLKLLPLIFGQIELSQLEIIGFDVLLETDQQGNGNWEFEFTSASADVDAEQVPASEGESLLTGAVLKKAVIQNATIVYIDGVTGTTQRFSIDEFVARMDSATAPLVIELTATYGDEPVELEGEFQGIAGLLNGGALDIDMTVSTLGATLEIEGTLDKPLAADGIDIAVDISGDSLSRLSEFAGSPVADLGEYNITAVVSGNTESLAVSDLVVSLEAAGATANVTGGVQDVISVQGIDISFSANGSSLSKVTKLAGAETPGLGAYSVEANIAGDLDAIAITNIVANLDAAGAQIKANGAIADVIAQTGIDVTLNINGNSLADLSTLAGTELPDLGAYRIAANFSGTAEKFNVTDLAVSIADMQIDGDLKANIAGEPLRIESTLHSPRIDLTLLLPPDDAAEISSAETRKTTDDSNGRVFPDDPLPLDALAVLDTVVADVSLTIGELIVDPDTTLKNLDIGIQLAPKTVSIKPLKLEAMEAKIDGRIELEVEQDAAVVVMKLKISHPSIGNLVEDDETTMLAGGALDLDIDITGSGTSIRSIMASLNGSLAVEMGDAQINNKWVQLAFADVSSLVGKKAGKRSGSEPIDLYCVTTQFSITDGVAEVDSLVIDTRGISLFGDGRVDLRDESLHLNFDRLSANVSASSVLPPFLIRGTFADPGGKVDTSALARNTLGLGAAILTKSEVERSDVTTATGPERCRQRLVVYEQVQEDRKLSKDKVVEILGDKAADEIMGDKAVESTKDAIRKLGRFFKKKKDK